VTQIAALSVLTSNRPMAASTAGSAAADHGQARAAEAHAAAPAQPAVSARNTPAPAAPLAAPGLMSALVDLQAHLEAAAPKAAEAFPPVAGRLAEPASGRGRADPGESSGHPDHVDNGHGGQHTDRGHHGKPPVAEPGPQPGPQPAPQPVVIPSFDPGAPARAIAEAAETLAQGRASEQARTAFVTAAVQRRSATYVAQGQAALAIFQQMQSQFAAWQADGATGQRGLYA
jgi:hypothetical protein